MTSSTIGRAVIVIEADPGQFTKDLDQKLTRDGTAAGDKAGKQTGWTFAKAVGANLVSTGVTKAADSVGNLFSAAFSKGFGRLTAIDDARGKLTGLGHDASSVDGIMKSALASVKNTSFGLGDAATIAATAVASGVTAGDELTARLKLTGDAATIAGTGLSEMGSIFGKVQTAQRAYTGELDMLADRGIPIYQWLQDELGLSAEALRKMVSDGKLDSATFFKVIQENIGGAALAGGQTFTGALANVGAAMGRLGASFTGPAFALMPQFFLQLIAAVEPLEPVFARWGAVVGQIAEAVLPKIIAGVEWLVRLLAGEIPNPFSGIDFSGLVTAFAQVRAAFSEAFADSGVTTQAIDLQVVVNALAGGMVWLAENMGKVLVGAGILAGAIALLTGVTQTANVVNSAFGADSGFRTAALFALAASNLATAAATRASTSATTANTAAIAANNGVTLTSVATKIRDTTVTVAKAVAERGAAIATGLLTIAQRGLNMAMRANPIGIIITVLAAFVAGLVWAYKNSETFRNVVNAVWTGIKVVVGAVVDWFANTVAPFFVGLWQSIAGGSEEGAGLFTRVWEGVKDFFAGLWEGIKTVFSGALEFLLGLFLTFHPLGIIIDNWGAISTFFVAVWDEIKATFSSALGAIVGFIMNWTIIGHIISNWGAISGFFIDLWNTVKNAFVSGLNAIWDFVGPWVVWFMGVFQAAWGVLQFLIALPIRLAQLAVIAAWEGISAAFSAAWSWVSGVFIGLWNGLTGLIGGVMTAVWSAIVKVWSDITTAFSAAWSWVSGVFMGWWNLLTGLIGAVMTAVWSAIVKVWSDITAAFTAGWNWISGVFMGWYTTLTSLITTVMTAVQNAINIAWQWITDRFTAAWNWVSGVFMGWYQTLVALITTVMTAVQNAISAAWQWITDRFSQAWQWVSGVFMGWWTSLTNLMETPIRLAREAIDRILEGIKTGFRNAVDFVQQTWDRIKEIVSSPVRVAIRVGNALINGFKTVAVAVGLTDIANRLVPIPDLPPMRTGGEIPGAFDPAHRDNVLAITGSGQPVARVEPGEYLSDRDTSRRHAALLRALPHLPSLPGFFQGGVMPTTAGAVNPHRLPYYGAQWAGDFPRPMGTGVFAWRPGTVAQTMYSNESYGNRIRINHPDGFGSSLYAHLSQIGVRVGQAVAQGARIGAVGTTGNSSGPHLHWERLGSTAAISASGSATAEATPAFDWVGDLIGKFATPLKELEAIGDSPVGAIVKQVPKLIADGMIDKVRTAAVALFDSITGSAGAATPGVAGAPLSGIGVTANTAKKGGEIAATARAAGHAISNIGGYRGDGEHVTRRALDFMVNNKAAGDFISNFVLGNRGRYGLQHVIWWQRINSGTGWRGMADRGSPTQNHMDHPHVLFSPADVGFDSGGWLKAGATRAVNKTGEPEAVLTGPQWQDVNHILKQLKSQENREQESSSRTPEVVRVHEGPLVHLDIHNPLGESTSETMYAAHGLIGAALGMQR